MQTKIIGGGVVFPGVEAAVDPLFQAYRISQRPLDYTHLGQNLGHYRAVMTTTAAAPAANSILAAIRWVDPSRYLVLHRIQASVQVVTVVTAQRLDPIVTTIARGYTVRDATAAGVVSLTGSNQKVRTSMGTSLISVSGNLDVATAAAGLAGGTKTLDAAPFGMLGISNSAPIAGLGTGANGDVYGPDIPGQHPVVLAGQEGVVVSWGPTALATGTVTVTIMMAWAEIAVY